MVIMETHYIADVQTNHRHSVKLSYLWLWKQSICKQKNIFYFQEIADLRINFPENNLLRKRWGHQVIYHNFMHTTQTADNFPPSEGLLLELKSSDHPSLVKRRCFWDLLGASCEDLDVAKLLEEKKVVG